VLELAAIAALWLIAALIFVAVIRHFL